MKGGHIQLTDESAGEDFIVCSAQLSSQIVGGDSTRSSCFLPVVHLSKEIITNQDKSKTQIHLM